MSQLVTNEEKKEFIKWFLNNKSLKRRESVWILNYISQHEDVLSNVHFVTKSARLTLLEEKQRLVFIATHCTDFVPFRYYQESVMSTDAEKSFHNIRLDRNSPLFVILQYDGVKDCPNYYLVTEDEELFEILSEPSGKKERTLSNLQEGYRLEINPKMSPIIDNLCDNLTHEFKVERLKADIDLALENNDKELFLKLSKQLNEITTPEKIYETIKTTVN